MQGGVGVAVRLHHLAGLFGHQWHSFSVAVIFGHHNVMQHFWAAFFI